MFQSWRKWLLISGFALVAMAGIFCGEEKTAAPITQERLPYKNLSDSATYVGMATCKGCHADIYETFIETGMGQSFGLATRSKSAAHFSPRDLIYDKERDLYYHPHWIGESLYIREFRLQGGDTVHRRDQKIDYIVGSGQHTNSHLFSVNGLMFQAPFTWYAQKGRWDLPPGFENGRNTRFSRIIGIECMSCHNALPGFDLESDNRFTRIPEGIDCERCHGPGSVHAAEKRRGELVNINEAIDYSIVNPAKLPWEYQIDVCQRCHLQGNAVLKPGKQFTDFRPGMRLHEIADVYMPQYTGEPNTFIMASHAERLQLSQCFIATNAKQGTKSLTCITCHDPHVSVKVTGKETFNNACRSCHAIGNNDGCKLALGKRIAVGNNCAQCHMPSSGTSDIPHVSVHDHKIGIPAANKASQAGLRQFAGIRSINNPGADELSRALAYIQYFDRMEGERQSLDSADQLIAKLEAQPQQQQATRLLETKVYLLFVKQDWNALAQLALNRQPEQVEDPYTVYRIGQALLNTGGLNQSQLWLQRAVKLKPAQPDFWNKLALVQLQLGNQQAARQSYEQMLELNPQSAQALCNLGYLYFLEGGLSKAESMYLQSLSLDPDYEVTLKNLAQLYLSKGENRKARVYLERILKNNPQDLQVKQLLQQLAL